MLTKQDLAQLEKLIRGIVREEIEAESENIRTELSADIRMSRMQVEEKLSELHSRFKTIEIKINKMQKDISTMIVMFDKEDMRLAKRVKLLEEHLGLNSN